MSRISQFDSFFVENNQTNLHLQIKQWQTTVERKRMSNVSVNELHLGNGTKPVIGIIGILSLLMLISKLLAALLNNNKYLALFEKSSLRPDSKLVEVTWLSIPMYIWCPKYNKQSQTDKYCVWLWWEYKYLCYWSTLTFLICSRSIL